MTIDQQAAVEQPPTLDDLATQWFNTKAKESQLEAQRVEIEKQICALTQSKAEGSKTDKTEKWKVTTTGKMTRKIDVEGFDAIAHQIPAEFHPIKTTRALDEKGLTWLKENRPAIYDLVVPLVTTTPAKTAVKCEPLAMIAVTLDGAA